MAGRYNYVLEQGLIKIKMNHSYRNNVVIIGGGPAGLGAALMLAKRGWTDITVLEKRPSADYYEPDKSFSYQIDGRGQKLTDLLEITPKIADLSVPSTEFYFTLVNIVQDFIEFWENPKRLKEQR